MFLSAECNQHMMHEPNRAFKVLGVYVLGGISLGGKCPGGK